MPVPPLHDHVVNSPALVESLLAFADRGLAAGVLPGRLPGSMPPAIPGVSQDPVPGVSQDPIPAVLPTPTPAVLPTWFLEGVEDAVRTATGPVGLGIVFVYSFLIAFVLPLPSEVVLAAPLKLGLSESVELTLLVVVSAAGKTLGSVVAFRLGRGVKHSGPVVRLLRRSRFDVVAWSERKTVGIARQHGHLGLAVALMVPGFPDTLSIYAFSALGEEYEKFAAATFAGSVGRLAVTLAIFGGAVALF